jgi:plastocyanin
MRPVLVKSMTITAVAVAFAGCGSGMTGRAGHVTARTPPRPRSLHGQVAIRDFMYAPMQLTITAGTAVTFHNDDNTAHTATATDGQFDTGTIRPGRSATVLLAKPGVYTYRCQFHAFMIATIRVARS